MPNAEAEVDNRPRKLYLIFGFSMASGYPFANRLEQGSGNPDVTFTCVVKPPIPSDWLKTNPIYSNKKIIEDGGSGLSIYRHEDCDIIQIASIMDFYIWHDRIICHLRDPAFRFLVEIRLLGDIFSLWLEKRGLLALHASAVAINGHAIAFLSANHGGKSTLSAALMQKGHPMLTNDVLPVMDLGREFIGRPGYPQMRMWPDQAEHFLGRYLDLEIAHPWYTKRRVAVGSDGLGVFCSKDCPLAALYLPVRMNVADSDIEIDAVSKREAAIELTRNTVNSIMVNALAKQERRMNILMRLVSSVPVRRFIYPSGFHNLPSVRDAIAHDLDAVVNEIIQKDL
ncbi:MAG: hypothetical protein AB9879_13050 [Methanothrix sp.]